MSSVKSISSFFQYKCFSESLSTSEISDMRAFLNHGKYLKGRKYSFSSSMTQKPCSEIFVTSISKMDSPAFFFNYSSLNISFRISGVNPLLFACLLISSMTCNNLRLSSSNPSTNRENLSFSCSVMLRNFSAALSLTLILMVFIIIRIRFSFYEINRLLIINEFS